MVLRILVILLAVMLAAPGFAAPTKKTMPALVRKPMLAPTRSTAPVSVKETKPTPAGNPATPIWSALERAFKPQGDEEQQAQQRIAFLEGLIRRFPGDKAHILSAYLDLGRQYEILKDVKSAARNYEQFLDQANPADKRRAKCMRQLLRALVAAREVVRAEAVFRQFYAFRPVEALAAMENICADECAWRGVPNGWWSL